MYSIIVMLLSFLMGVFAGTLAALIGIYAALKTKRKNK